VAALKVKQEKKRLEEELELQERAAREKNSTGKRRRPLV